MATEAITEPETNTTTEDMDLENPNPNPSTEDTPTDCAAKRDREEAEDTEENGGATKKQKVEDDEKSVEEVRMEKLEDDKENEGEEKDGVEEKPVSPVNLGPKTFGSAVDMFNYFYQLLHRWPMHIKFNKYEHLVLVELIRKGHPEPEKKMGSGIDAFVIRQHPQWNSRCFFVMRADNSVEDFSFRKCVDHILPLPEDMKIKSETNKVLGGGGKKGGGGGGRGGGRGRGRGRSGRGRR